MILIDFKIIAMYSNKNVLMQTIFQSVILPNLTALLSKNLRMRAGTVLVRDEGAHSKNGDILDR